MLLACFAAGAVNEPASSPAKADYLRCEYRVDPLGIDVCQPRLSWEMQDARRGAAQSAYQILAATSAEKLAAGEADLWDSGKVTSAQSAQIVYAGKPLASRTQCFWKVRLWDAQGNPTAYSEPAKWSMGLLEPGDVQAKWIGVEGPMIHPAKGTKIDLEGCSWVWFEEKGGDPMATPKGPRFFRGSVTIPPGRRIARATALIGADDSFEFFVNGRPSSRGQSFKEPQTVDITHHLDRPTNTLAVVATNATPGPAGLIGKIKIELEQGEPIVQCIDGSWKATDKSAPGWNTPDGDASAWPNAKVIAKFGDQPWGKVAAGATGVLGCPQFRKEFDVKQPIRRATVYASALGCYRLEINGKPVGDDYFTPDWTDYKTRVYYNTYDVTDLVRGDAVNAIGGTLAGGWYAGAIGWKTERFNYGTEPKLWAQLELELADGTRQVVVTDESWKTAFGPYLEGEFLAGEHYDARQELGKWSQTGFDAAAWKPVKATGKIDAKLEAFPGVNVRETGRIEPIGITEPEPGVFVFDMGQNFAGFAQLKAKGPAGTKIVLRFAEMLNPDGKIYTTNLRGARATDTYVLKGEGEEVWQPRFTFHGFRYVEVTGYPGRPTKEALTGIAINSVTPMVGSFQCSSPMVNQLYSNILWTQRANFISVPTDCPQRDERLGWTGDAQVFIRAASYNADVAAFFTKWLVDLEDAQTKDGAFTDVAPIVLGLGHGTAAWADAGTICPWTTYWVYNDKRVLEKHYGAMARWVEFCKQHSKDLLRPAEGYGDWLSIKADTPKEVLATAYFAYSTDLTAKAARVLGKEAEAKEFEALFEQIKAAFNKAYVSDDGHIKGDTQTGYVLALWFNLLPEGKREAAQRYLVEDIQKRDMHLSTGFNGTAYLMPTLAAIGHNDVAYRLLLNDTFPSWGYSIKHGATSIWERWDGWTADKGFQDPGMNSFAHYSFGAVARWMFQSVAGIDTDGPGYERLIIRPEPNEGLSWVKASYRSLHGSIASEWKTTDQGLTLEVTVPANTTATVYVPADKPERVTEGGKPAADAEGVKFLRAEPGKAVYAVGAGQYRFEVAK
jgi:alpha-L-rhamnosidase